MDKLVKKLSRYAFIIGAFGAVIVGGYVMYVARDLPDVRTISTYVPSETTKIYSSDGIVLAELHQEENRIVVPLEKISPYLKQAVVATEDTEFYNHHGVNVQGIFRAAIKNAIAGRFVEGGSTLTQQLARNIFLHKRRKISRKVSEAILAIQIERYYTKDEILQMYLNQVYWGHNAYGIESASQMYFGKHAENLNLAESAMLVGLLTGPELYSPLKHFDRAKERQKIVLGRLTKLDIITKEQAQDAYDQALVIPERRRLRYKAPFFTFHIIHKLIEMYGEEATYTSGIRVYTTLNYALQLKAEEVVKHYVAMGANPNASLEGDTPVGANLGFTQGALLAIDPRNGYILAMQGGADFVGNEFNRVTQAKRQPGSAFKPFVYLAALQRGFSPGSMIDDSPVTFNTVNGPYSPKNYTGDYQGRMSMRRALELSVNVVSIKLNNIVGPRTVVNVAKQIGIKSRLQPVLSLPLGANEVSMLELASAYGVFANMGRRVEPTAIIRIEDRDGNLLYEHHAAEKQVFDENLIAALVDMLKGAVKNGTGRAASLPRPMAGKTGTTSDYKDAWFFGFVPQMVCATWVGNDDNTPMNKVTGGSVPALMWRDFMSYALNKVPMQDFGRPKGLVERKVNWDTGNLANEYSPEERVTEEKYWKGAEPVKTDKFTSHNDLPQSDVGTTPAEEENVVDFFKR